MGNVAVEVSREFAGSAPVAYGIPADSHEGHPSTLARPWFTHLDLERVVLEGRG